MEEYLFTQLDGFLAVPFNFALVCVRLTLWTISESISLVIIELKSAITDGGPFACFLLMESKPAGAYPNLCT